MVKLDLQEKYLQPIKKAIENKNNPYNNQAPQVLKPLPKVDFVPLNNLVLNAPKQGQYLTELGINTATKVGRTVANIPSAFAYSNDKKLEQPKDAQVGFTDVSMKEREAYQPVGTPDLDSYKSVKASMDAKYDYANMNENVKKSYEMVTNEIIRQESTNKDFNQQREAIQSLYQDREIPEFVQKKLQGIDSREMEYNLKIENARQKLVKMSDMNLQDQLAFEKKYENEDILEGTKFTGKVLGTIIEMSPYVAASAIGGVGSAAFSSILGTGTMYAQVYTDSMARAIDEGATREQATQYAHVSAMIEAGTEMLSGGIPLAPKGLLSSGVQGMLDDVIRAKIKDGAIRKFLATGVDVFGEGAEEALAEYLGSIALTIYREDERTDEELTQAMIESFVMGAITSGTLQMGKYTTLKLAEKFVAEKSMDISNVSVEEANKVMNNLVKRVGTTGTDGLSYIVQDMPRSEKGYYDPKSNQIVLNQKDVEENGLINSALPHEMVHALERIKGYDDLANFVLAQKQDTLDMTLEEIRQVYQEKFDQVHQAQLESGNAEHTLEIASNDKMVREFVAEFIKENIASRVVKDASGNIKVDSNGNIVTYRNYDALLRLASNKPNALNNIKKVIRKWIRNGKIADAQQYEQSTKLAQLTTESYLESLDEYIGNVLNNADKGLFSDYALTDDIQYKVSNETPLIQAYETENDVYNGTREDAEKLLAYSDKKGLGFNEVKYDGGTLVRNNTIQLSIDQLQKNEIDVNELKNVSKGKDDLVVLHNTTEEKLLKTLKLGGFPVPSLAVTRSDFAHDNFGEISVIFNKNTIQNEPTFTVDAYTTRTPLTFMASINDEDYKALSDYMTKFSNLEGYNRWSNYIYDMNNKTYDNATSSLERVMRVNQTSEGIKILPLAKAIFEDINGIELNDEYIQTNKDTLQSQMEDAFNTLFERFNFKEYFWNGRSVVTNNGRRNHRALLSENNLDNITNFMTRNDIALSESSNDSGGMMQRKSLLENPMMSILDIKKNRKKLEQMNQSTYEDLFNEADSILYGISQEVEVLQGKKTDATIGELIDDMFKEDNKSFTPKNIEKFFTKYGYDFTNKIGEDLSDSIAYTQYFDGLDENSTYSEVLAKVIKEVKNLNVGYFETKPQRSVGFSEIEMVLIPNYSSDKLKSSLESKNIPYQVYEDTGDENEASGRTPIIKGNQNWQFSIETNILTKLNLSTIIPLIEQSKQSASDYINSVVSNIEPSDKSQAISDYVAYMSNFVRDYNPDLRMDSVGHLTTQAQEDNFNVRENGKLKVFYYENDSISDNALSYGHFLLSNPLNLENAKQVYVNANLVDANGMEFSKLDELYEDMSNADVLKQYGSEELLKQIETELGFNGLQFDGSVMVFNENQYKSTEIKPTIEIESIETIVFKKNKEQYEVSQYDENGETIERNVLYNDNQLINTFGREIAKNILNYATDTDVSYKIVENILAKPSKFSNMGNFTNQRDDNNNQLSRKQLEFFEQSKIRQKDGTLKVLYHGTNIKFDEFDYSKMNEKGKAYGYGFYFTDDSMYAYSHGKEIMEVYLNVKKPIDDYSKTFDEKTIKEMIQSFFNVIEYEFDNPRMKLPEIDRFYKSYFSGKTDMAVINGLIQMTGINKEEGLKIVNDITEIDGFEINKGSYGKIFVAFFPEQIKSINNPNPTTSRNIQYSIELDSTKKQQIAQAKLNVTNNFSDARTILNDGTVTTSDSVPFDSVLLDPLYNQAIINQVPTQAQKEQLQAFYLDTLGRSGDTVYLELHNDDKVAYLKYPVVSDLNRINEDIAKFYQDDSQRKEFFKDSKVRDKNGDLLKMYHGTPSGVFTQFKSGTYFTSNKEYADKYQNAGASSISARKAVDSPKTYEVYLNITKPFDTRNPEIRKIYEKEYLGKWGNSTPLMESGLPDWLEGIDLQEFIEEKGYDFDGLILDEGATGGYGEDVSSRGISYVVFNPNQVKNVDNLTPTLSNDIRYSIDDERIATRSFQMSALQSSNEQATKDSIETSISKGDFSYIVVADKASVDKAILKFEALDNDIDKAYNQIITKMDSGDKLDKDFLTFAQLTLKKLEKTRDTEKVMRLIQDIAVLGTELGQQVQALSLIKRMTPTGQLLTLQRTLNRMKSKYAEEGTQVKLNIPKEYQEFFVEAQARADELIEQKQAYQDQLNELAQLEQEVNTLTSQLDPSVQKQYDELTREIESLDFIKRENNRLNVKSERLTNALKAYDGVSDLNKSLNTHFKGLSEQLAKTQELIKENNKTIAKLNKLNEKLDSLVDFIATTDKQALVELNNKIKLAKKGQMQLDKLIKSNVEFTSQKNIEETIDELKVEIAQQLPVTTEDKVRAWRYLSMLGNPRTHVRNFLGNAAMMPLMFSRDVLSVAMQQFIPENQRTKVLFASKEALEFAKKDYQEHKKEFSGTQKYDMQSELERERKIYNTKFLEWLRVKNFAALEWGDDIYVGRHYSRQLAKYITAQKIDVNNATEEQLIKAREYALNEAQKATFKDESKVANALNQLTRAKNKKGKQTKVGLAVEATIPFKKTPINIIKRGIEYSPIGLAQGIVTTIDGVRKGNLNATQAIDQISAGLTGTGVALMGALMFSLGIIEIGDDDDETKRVYGFKNALGRQRYSVKIGQDSYSIDWIAPAIMPFIMGATIQKVMTDSSEEGFIDAVWEGALDIMDPIFELTMLQGVTSTFQSSSGSGVAMAGEAFTTMASNYINQFIPTLLGQIARTVDPIQRSTNPDAKGSLSGLIETTARKVANKVPVASYMFNAPVVNVKGEYISASENPFMRAFLNFVSPGYYKKGNVTPDDEEILRLYEITQDTNVLPKTASKYFTDNKIKYDLGNQDYSDFANDLGDISYDVLGAFIDTHQYDTLDDIQKGKMLTKIYDYAYDVAKDNILKKQGKRNSDAGYVKLKDAETRGIKPIDYLSVKSIFDTLSGEDKKEQFYRYLRENNYDVNLYGEIIGGYKVKSDLDIKGLDKIKVEGLEKSNPLGLVKLK